VSRENDKKWIWVVSPIKSNDGEIRIQGYTRLRKMKLACTPANGYIDFKTYGSKVNRIYKFNDNKPIDIDIDGGDGIYFEEPTVDETDGLYKQPTLISEPLTHFGKQWTFNAEKQVY
jgi:hypothetical protein